MVSSMSSRHKGRHHLTALVHKQRRQLDQVRNEINVTPLVDVCLVLLIIFMVVTPMLARGKEVSLPRTLNHQTETDQNQPIVAMDRDGLMYFDKEPIDDITSLKSRIEEHWRETGAEATRRVFVKGDTDLTFGQVYPILVALHDLGTPGIDLGTNEKKSGDE
jgi:biopolymer transport protein TolR